MQPELRLHPRMPIDLPAELLFRDGNSVDVRLLNLSLGGVAVAGDQAMRDAIERHIPAFPVELDIQFGLLGEPVNCHCRLIHTRRQSQSAYQLGFKLLSTDERCATLIRQVLEDYEAALPSAS